MVDFQNYILEAYKDTSEPDYSFVKTALQTGLYSEMASEFSKLGFAVHDDTEPNTDVSRTFILSKDDIQACVKLSFVGPFAAAFVLNGAGSKMDNVLHLLDTHGFYLVSKDTLIQPYAIDLLDLDSDPTLYNALFSSDRIP